MAKKKAAKKKKATKKAGAKRRIGYKSPPEGRKFQKGNKAGVGHGRPPTLGSPRAQLKRYVEEKAPKKVRDAIKKLMPDVDVNALTWAECIAIRHLAMTTEGNLAAIVQTYKQVDDSGADKQESNIGAVLTEVIDDLWREKNDDGDA